MRLVNKKPVILVVLCLLANATCANSLPKAEEALKLNSQVISSANASLSANNSATVNVTVHPDVRIAILIDDMGDNRALGERALALKGDISYAFLPHTQFAASLARAANQLGRDVLLHAPMESEEHLSLMGRGALTTSMSEQDLRVQLRANFDSIPFVQGFNNHMGSVLTRDRQRMRWLFEEAKARNVFFVDSRTTAESVALPEARAMGIPSFGRDIFLDHEDSASVISRQFDRLIQLARKRGFALAIGHPKKNTLAVLEKRLLELDALGVVLVPVSKLTSSSWRAQAMLDSTQIHAVGARARAPSMNISVSSAIGLNAFPEPSSPKTSPLVCAFPKPENTRKLWFQGQQLMRCMAP